MRSFRYHRLSLLLFIPGLMLSGARAAAPDQDTGMTGLGTLRADRTAVGRHRRNHAELAEAGREAGRS